MEKISILGFLLVILCLITRDLACKGETLEENCLRADREALLDFKNGLKDSSNNRLSSWIGGNCCQWEGIGCENNTRVVISINLHNPYSPEEAYENWSSMNLNGEIRPSLIELKSLRYLYLSGNSFEHIPIPKFFGFFKTLQYLNLSNCGFRGAIPPTLGNLSNLQFLDLSSNKSDQLFVKDLEWMISLVSLKHLKMNYVNLSMVGSQWMEVLNKLSFLTELHLQDCGLSGSISSLNSINFTSLSVISISGNSFRSNLVYIDVSSNQLYGHISPGLGELPNLQHLNLSENENLTGSCSQLLSGSWKKIEFLNLTNNKFFGTIPTSIGNFCNLKHLDLGHNTLTGSFAEFLKEIKNCSSEGPLLELRYLRLSWNQLVGRLPERLSQLEKLTFLCLSGNKFQGPIPASFGTFKNLNEILPVSFGQLSKLVVLVVYDNRLTGILSEEHFSKLSKLKSLWIGKNSGLVLNVSSTWSHHSKSLILIWLSEEHFSKLSKLKTLWMDGNSGLVLNVSSSWVPPFQITYLGMNSCNLGPSFPTWLRSQKKVSWLDLSNASISGSIPKWFWNISFNLQYLLLSDNQLRGTIPTSIGNICNLEYLRLSSNTLTGILFEEHFSKLSKLKTLSISRNSDLFLNVSSTWVPPFQIIGLNMHSCNLGPSFPTWLRSQKEVSWLDLSNASISGSIPKWFWNISFNLQYLSLLDNQITGTIPDSIGHNTPLRVIDFSRNNLTGSIPSTINNCSSLIVLDLGNNNLSGKIPKSLGQLQWLESLHLNDNKLSGELPSSFQNLSRLELLDLSYNQLSSKLPSWIGTAFINLVILNLRSNVFFGRLPSQLSNLSSLHVLDLAQNNLMGEIPTTLVELKAMVPEYNKNIYLLYHNGSNSGYEEGLVVIMKGQSLEYTRTFSLVVGIDLSDNNLSGEFPQEITKLFGLVALNLSGNHITGQIPESISMLHQLLSLDLSSNKLSGSIPSSMVSLTFLSYLNLSNNNFYSKIPFIGQMTTFNESAFVGNPNLCGAPLVTKCQDEDLDKKYSAIEDKNDGGYIDQWFYLSVGLGSAMGILVPYFVLATRKSWCEAYFDFVDKIVKWLLRGRATYAKDHLRR
ncbi:hypothetical protein PVL29_012176 [Vitis rotundifolia]|uniref:Leucine-rich repeat-containing N-terminal plant-type domain-containing protein n=1 Tax=Vitis rotundifolia TaxID=103349 RepID=A0AA39DRS7_VITRO|nr:hypothetical protein PVL29_012176 [Vitis rotundifolia]